MSGCWVNGLPGHAHFTCPHQSCHVQSISFASFALVHLNFVMATELPVDLIERIYSKKNTNSPAIQSYLSYLRDLTAFHMLNKQRDGTSAGAYEKF